MRIVPPPGLASDTPEASDAPLWLDGENIRFRQSDPRRPARVESIGLWAAMRDGLNGAVAMNMDFATRGVNVTQNGVTHTIIGAVAGLNLLTPDSIGPVETGRRWTRTDITPVSFAQAAPMPSGVPRSVVQQPTWSFAASSDLVVCCYSSSANPIFRWDDTLAGANAVALANSPQNVVAIAVSDDNHLVCLGSDPVAGGDPTMTVRWSAADAYETWTPSTTNTAGDFPLSIGSTIIGGGKTARGIMCWTDSATYRINQLDDGVYIFGSETVDPGIGLMATDAWVEAAGRVWWLGDSGGLYAFDGGRVSELECPLRALSLDLVADENLGYIRAFSNHRYNEVGWIMQTCEDGNELLSPAEVGACTVQLVYNYALDAWSIWRLPRLCWVDGKGLIEPLAVDADRTVYRHELRPGFGALKRVSLGPGWDAPGVMLEPRPWSVGTTRFGVESRDAALPWATTACSRVVMNRKRWAAPNQDDADSTLDVTIRGYENLDDVQVEETGEWTASSTYIEPRVEGRAIDFTISTQGAGSYDVTRLGDVHLALASPGGASRGRR